MQVSLRLSSPAAIVPTVYSSYPGWSAGSCQYLPSQKTLRGPVPGSALHQLLFSACWSFRISLTPSNRNSSFVLWVTAADTLVRRRRLTLPGETPRRGSAVLTIISEIMTQMSPASPVGPHTRVGILFVIGCKGSKDRTAVSGVGVNVGWGIRGQGKIISLVFSRKLGVSSVDSVFLT